MSLDGKIVSTFSVKLSKQSHDSLAKFTQIRENNFINLYIYILYKICIYSF